MKIMVLNSTQLNQQIQDEKVSVNFTGFNFMCNLSVLNLFTSHYKDILLPNISAPC